MASEEGLRAGEPGPDDRIEVGRRVRVDFVPIPGETQHFEAWLVGRPQRVGDTFRFRFDDGRVIEINPNSSSFEAITEIRPRDEVDEANYNNSLNDLELKS